MARTWAENIRDLFAIGTRQINEDGQEAWYAESSGGEYLLPKWAMGRTEAEAKRNLMMKIADIRDALTLFIDAEMKEMEGK